MMCLRLLSARTYRLGFRVLLGMAHILVLVVVVRVCGRGAAVRGHVLRTALVVILWRD